MAVLASLVALGSARFAVAQPLAPPKYVAGTHYEVLPSPVKIVRGDKIEVMEIFWYGCGHCQDFEPLLHGWQQSAPADVELRKTPAVWRPQMRSHATLYYVAEAADAPHELHAELFELLVKNRSLDDEKKFAEVFARHGISEEKFAELYKSFAITTRVNQAEKRLRKHYRAQGTPEIIVNGKYRIGTSMAGGQPQMLDVTNFLIEQERKALRAAGSKAAAQAS
ncbi:MAG: thiol:disulfide interchange protein DsbA/DsbL [Pseudomonadales bacterium]